MTMSTNLLFRGTKAFGWIAWREMKEPGFYIFKWIEMAFVCTHVYTGALIN